ncbi:MAG: hypothetical protein EX271_08655, partial [Acidimicrobiales bacterium]
MGRTLILVYGIVAYGIGVAGLVCIILALAKFVPFGYWGDDNAVGNPILWNLSLVMIWGFIHSIMARPSFKARITEVIPEPIERSTYVLVAGLTSICLIGFWKNTPGHVWHFEVALAVYILWAIFVFGWVFLLASTFAINHFDLFGLRQVYMNYKSQYRPPVNFVKRAMYR